MKINNEKHVTKDGIVKRNPPKKIKVKSISIYRAEGSMDDPYINKWVSFPTFKQALSHLRSSSFNAPKTGGYDKHDFKVVWEDGNTYSGRLDIKGVGSDEERDIDVGAHIKGWFKYVIERSPTATQKDKLQAKRFLAKYSLSDNDMVQEKVESIETPVEKKDPNLLSDVQLELAKQIRAKELHQRGFKLLRENDGTLIVAKGYKAMFIKYDQGSDLYNVIQREMTRNFDVKSEKKLHGIYFDSLPDMIEQYFHFEYLRF